MKERLFTLLSRKFTGEATLSELHELDDLIKQHPDQQLPLEFLEEYWQHPAEKDLEFLEATYHLHLNRLKQKGFDISEARQEQPAAIKLPILPKKIWQQQLSKMAIAAAAAIVAVAGVYFLSTRQTKNVALAISADTVKVAQSEVSTKSGSRTKIVLPDGTLVWLNGNSKLTYDNQHYGETQREVTLAGEGYFDVVKNPEKPFVIRTGKMDIKVTGTAFNVRCYPGEKLTETSLIRGSIEVKIKNRKGFIILKPSEKLIIADEAGYENTTGQPTTLTPLKFNRNQLISLTHLTVLPKDSTIAETAWVENRLAFNNEPFEIVASKMEKWYNVEIRFADEKLKKENLTAIYKNETVTEALHALQYSTNFNFKINNNIITLSK